MRVSVTELDALAYYKRSEHQDLNELLRRLRKEEPPSEPMLMGGALHRVLENLQAGMEVDEIQSEGFHFHFNLDEDCSLPPIRELKGEREYDIDGQRVVLSAVVDGLEGKSVREFKLTQRMDVDSYCDAIQWRAYLAIFNADCCTYDVFVRSNKPGPHVWINERHSWCVWRYPKLEEDVERELREFVYFCRQHLPERTEAA